MSSAQELIFCRGLTTILELELALIDGSTGLPCVKRASKTITTTMSGMVVTQTITTQATKMLIFQHHCHQFREGRWAGRGQGPHGSDKRDTTTYLPPTADQTSDYKTSTLNDGTSDEITLNDGRHQ